MFLKANAKHGYGKLQKKSHISSWTHPLGNSLIRDGILLLYHLNLRWPCDLLWSTERGGNRVVQALCLSSKKPGTHFTPPLGEGDHHVNNPPVACWRMRVRVSIWRRWLRCPNQEKPGLAQITTMEQNPAPIANPHNEKEKKKLST